VTGTKIFISAGDHDLCENIVHVVLARLPDAPAGTRGISLFIIPKFLPSADGAGRLQQRRVQRHRAQDGHQGLGHVHHRVRGLAEGFMVFEPNRGLEACSPS
jgi:alkylation response protein AidB-like acyl-CoA dehydrogenase